MPDGNTGIQSGVPLDAHDAGKVFDAFYSELPPDKEKADEAPPASEAEAPADAEEVEEGDADNAVPEGDEPSAKPDDDEEAAEPPAQPSKHKVKVRGVEEEVTLDEALAGYSRTADYTRDKQALANDRRAFDAEKAANLEKATVYAQRLAAVEEALKANNSEPDWDKVRVERPAEYLALRDAWAIHKDRMQLVANERQKVEREVAEAQMQKHQELLRNEGQKLIDAVPEWKDADKATAGLTELYQWAKSRGFSDQELQGINDHRTMMVLRDAMLHEKGAKAAAKQSATADKKIADAKVKPATPGSSASTKPTMTKRGRAIQQFKKSGRMEEAGKAFEHFFAD